MLAKETLPVLKFYNTETRQKEEFKPLAPPEVKLYTCGPTVYDFAHIGNFRTYVFEDLLRRTLEFFGYKIKQVMNLTDVDDKTIKGATAKKISLDHYTYPFKEAFFQDLDSLNIKKVEHYPAATDYIQPMIEVIQGLLKKGIAYKGGDGSIYFAISRFPRYGCLSHLKLNELKVNASDRIANDEYDKDTACDFVLWKKYDPTRDGSIFWESPFGQGRPGWHLECSTMAMQLLGTTIDIHVGGVDNIFPHHENEIAQSEAFSGQQFAKLWMHSEHLLVDNRKMSKSLGNFFTLRNLLEKGYTGPQIRYLLLQTHYKTQLNFTLQGMEAAKGALHRLQDFILRLNQIQSENESGAVFSCLKRAQEQFTAALADDLNISVALASLFELVREVNILCDENKLSRKEAEKVLQLLKNFDSILGVLNFETIETIPKEIEEMALQRHKARIDKDWKRADQLRQSITAKGFQVEDTAAGPRVKKG